jgi:hypothetical protein
MRWTEHVGHIRKKRNAYRFMIGKLEEHGNFKELVVNGRIILNYLLRKLRGKMRNGFMLLWIVTSCFLL